MEDSKMRTECEMLDIVLGVANADERITGCGTLWIYISAK